MKRTILFETHQKLGGKLIEFGGWEMPVQYTGIVDEHLAVRRAAGLFDISHMGEVVFEGPSAARFLNELLTNDITKLAPGQGQYTLMCNERGGVIDDLYAYRLADQEYLLIINASRIDDDVAWMENRLKAFNLASEIRFQNRSQSMGALALQGPAAVRFIGDCFPGSSTGGTQVARVIDLKKNQVGRFAFEGAAVWVARTGYTGEDGFEIVGENRLIPPIWNQLLTAGQGQGLKPAGLGARDTLRTEVCYPLYGHELDEDTSPMEAGLGFFVALDKGEFVGRVVLAQQKAGGPAKRLVAFKMTEKSAPPRAHYPIYSSEETPSRLGEVTSGTQSPSLSVGIGMGYVPPNYSKAGTPLAIEIRGKRSAAVTVAKPIYRKAD